LKIPLTVDRISQILASLDPAERDRLPANRSAKYRAMRLALYQREVRSQNLLGVLLAHHADDQAETVMLRLIRGGGFASLSAMSERTRIGDVVLLRPLLGVRRKALLEHLREIGQEWREDASNARDDQARNRVRKVLLNHPEMTTALSEVAMSCRRLHEWTGAQSPELAASFPVQAIWNLPEIVAGFALGEWLRERGVRIDQISSRAIQELLIMCSDAASPARIAMPGGLIIRRRGGEIFMD
jgi:tRNA(Ile)-lysidine synthase